MPEDSGSWYKSSTLSLNWVACISKKIEKPQTNTLKLSPKNVMGVPGTTLVGYKQGIMLGTFLKDFSQAERVFSELATS